MLIYVTAMLVLDQDKHKKGWLVNSDGNLFYSFERLHGFSHVSSHNKSLFAFHNYCFLLSRADGFLDKRHASGRVKLMLWLKLTSLARFLNKKRLRLIWSLLCSR